MDDYRDGKRATELAKTAINLKTNSSYPLNILLDTLAAAYGEEGQFDDAVKTEEKAIDLLKKEGGDESRITNYTKRLESYKAHKPWREK